MENKSIERMSKEKSYELFDNAFESFSWEVLEVYTSSPVIVFSWRHWGKFTGSYKNNKGDGKLINLYGYAIIEVNEDFKLCKSMMYFNRKAFLDILEGN